MLSSFLAYSLVFVEHILLRNYRYFTESVIWQKMSLSSHLIITLDIKFLIGNYFPSQSWWHCTLISSIWYCFWEVQYSLDPWCFVYRKHFFFPAQECITSSLYIPSLEILKWWVIVWVSCFLVCWVLCEPLSLETQIFQCWLFPWIILLMISFYHVLCSLFPECLLFGVILIFLFLFLKILL